MTTLTPVPGCGAEVNGGGPGQVGAGDGDRGAAGLWARGRADRGDGRTRCVVGELVTAVPAEVPLGVVTVTLTVPVPAGEVAVTEVAR